MRTSRHLFILALVGASVGCESADTNTAAVCKVTDVATGEVTEFWTSDYGSSSEAVAACGAYGLAVNGSGEGTTAPDTDDGSAADVEDGDPVTGAETMDVYAVGDVLTWITVDGVRICNAKSRVFWDVNPESTFTVGYGWGGQVDWETLTHSADQFRFDGILYTCEVSAFTPVDENGLFVQNFTRQGSKGPDDYTNWSKILEGDAYACVTGETSSGAPTYAFAFSIHQDRDTYWRLEESSQGSCEAAVD